MANLKAWRKVDFCFGSVILKWRSIRVKRWLGKQKAALRGINNTGIKVTQITSSVQILSQEQPKSQQVLQTRRDKVEKPSSNDYVWHHHRVRLNHKACIWLGWWLVASHRNPIRDGQLSNNWSNLVYRLLRLREKMFLERKKDDDKSKVMGMAVGGNIYK